MDNIPRSVIIPKLSLRNKFDLEVLFKMLILNKFLNEMDNIAFGKSLVYAG